MKSQKFENKLSLQVIHNVSENYGQDITGNYH